MTNFNHPLTFQDINDTTVDALIAITVGVGVVA